MITAILLGVLVLFDTLMCGFRVVAGRDGRIDKRRFYRDGIVRGGVMGALVIAANAAAVAALVATAPDRAATWRELVAAGNTCVVIFGSFATATLAAIAFWLIPVEEVRLVPTLVVLGPLTLLRPLVIAAGLTIAAAGADDPRVWIAAALAAVSMLGFERVLGRAHADRWRRLL